MIENNGSYITVGIPTYNSSKYLVQCLNSIKNFNFINEIIISDDCSTNSELLKIQNIILSFQKNKNLNIKFFKNEKNLGAFANKLKILKKSKNEIVYILDSDNIAAKNLEKIIKNHIIANENSDFLYQPGRIYHFWDQYKLSKFLSLFSKKYKVIFTSRDLSLNKYDILYSLLNNSGNYKLNLSSNLSTRKNTINNLYDRYKNFPKDKWIMWVLNCGNFIVHRNTMLNVANEGLKFGREINSLDAVTFSYLWLNSGKEIYLSKDFYHFHRKRNDSVSFVEQKNTPNAIAFFINKILDFGFDDEK